MFADLMAEMPAGERYAEAARGWLEGVLSELFPDLRDGLQNRPSTRAISKYWDVGPEGEPGQVRGEIEVAMRAGRSRTAVFTDVAWQRFLSSLGKSPVIASLSIRLPGPEGGGPVRLNCRAGGRRRCEGRRRGSGRAPG